MALWFVLALLSASWALASGGVAAAAPVRVKPQIVGLVDKSTQTPYVLRQPFPTVTPDELAPDARAFAGIVVNETWAQLEPAHGHFSFGPLQKSLAAVRAYNRVHRRYQLVVKLRIFGGFTAPQWAKTLKGTSPITFATASAAGTTGRWWTPAYRAAWSTFQHKLAARFDDVPLVASVAVSSCATLTAEPFVQSPNLALHTELFAAGWSSAAQQQCLRGAFSDYSGWKRTPIDYSFNPFVDYTPGKQLGIPDPAFTNAIMTRCANLSRTAHRTCILSNHALTASVSTSRSAPVYTEINALYAKHPRSTPVDFQTGPPDNFGGCQAINLAVAHHAESLELWPPAASAHGFKGFSAYPAATLAAWSRALARRRPAPC